MFNDLFGFKRRRAAKAAEGIRTYNTSYMPGVMRSYLTEVAKAYSSPIVAGGAVLAALKGWDTKDVDVFVPSTDTVDQMRERLTRVGLVHGPTYGNKRVFVPDPEKGLYTSYGSLVVMQCELSSGNAEEIGSEGYPYPVLSVRKHLWPLEVIALPAVDLAGMKRIIRSRPIPLLWGMFDGLQYDLPRETQEELQLNRVAVIKDQLPEDTAGRLDIHRRIQRLVDKTGWPVVYI